MTVASVFYVLSVMVNRRLRGGERIIRLCEDDIGYVRW